MARREPLVVVFKPTQVRQPDGRVIVLMPGLKSDRDSERIRSRVSKSQMEQMKKGGRVTEDTPPWND